LTLRADLPQQAGILAEGIQVSPAAAVDTSVASHSQPAQGCTVDLLPVPPALLVKREEAALIAAVEHAPLIEHRVAEAPAAGQAPQFIAGLIRACQQILTEVIGLCQHAVEALRQAGIDAEGEAVAGVVTVKQLTLHAEGTD